MKAFVITPGIAGSGRLEEVPEPTPAPNEAVVEVLEIGCCGTDRELLSGAYGEAPPGSSYLTIGHESLGRVALAPTGPLEVGELVVAMVRRPDPEPCVNCAAGEWDMCLNGQYTERGIKGAHGYLAERYAEDPTYLVRVPREISRVAVLLEPLSIVEKGIEQTQRIQSRLVWSAQRALVLGAGPIGTLASLLLRLEGVEVWLYSQGDGGQGREIAEAAGAHFMSADDRRVDHRVGTEIGPIDMVVEATGFSPLAFDAMCAVGPNGVVCLMGVSAGSRSLRIDADLLNLEMVLENKLVFGTVNANRRHFEKGVEDLGAMARRWPGLLEHVITRRVPVDRFSASDFDHPGDLKVVVQVG